MLDTRVPICKLCSGYLRRVFIKTETYKGHVFICVNCATPYYICGEGQAENELYVEYDNPNVIDAGLTLNRSAAQTYKTISREE